MCRNAHCRTAATSAGYWLLWDAEQGRWVVEAPDGRVVTERPRTWIGALRAADRDVSAVDLAA